MAFLVAFSKRICHYPINDETIKDSEEVISESEMKL